MAYFFNYSKKRKYIRNLSLQAFLVLQGPTYHTFLPFYHTSLPHLPTTPSHHTSLPHLPTTPLYHTFLPHLPTTPPYHTSLPHLSTTPPHHTSLPHLPTTPPHHTSSPHLPLLSNRTLSRRQRNTPRRHLTYQTRTYLLSKHLRNPSSKNGRG